MIKYGKDVFNKKTTPNNNAQTNGINNSKENKIINKHGSLGNNKYINSADIWVE